MKNKKISTLLFAAVFSSMVMTGCEDEVLVPVEDNTKVAVLLSRIDSTSTALVKIDAANNTLLIQNAELEKTLDELSTPLSTKIQYTVNVLSAANTVFGSGANNNNWRTAGVAGVPNVSIRLEQAGNSITATSTESGMAIFNDLKPGYANVYVTGSTVNHTDVEYRVYLGGNNSSESVLNAASQIVLFPTSTTNATTIQGTAFINLRADDDTLGRKYAENYSVTTLAGKYLSKPTGMGFDRKNYYYEDNNWNWDWLGTIFETGSTDVNKVKYDVAAGHTIYAFPDFPTSAINNVYSTDGGYISQISYKGAIVSTKVAADGTYSLQVPASNVGMDVRIEIEKVVANHTRLTMSASNRSETVGTDLSGTGFETPNSWELGTGNEMGSVIAEYKNVTNKANASTVTGTDITSVKRRVITQQYVYKPMFSNTWGSYYNYSIWRDARSGNTTTMNIYLEPSYKN